MSGRDIKRKRSSAKKSMWEVDLDVFDTPYVQEVSRRARKRTTNTSKQIMLEDDYSSDSSTKSTPVKSKKKQVKAKKTQKQHAPEKMEPTYNFTRPSNQWEEKDPNRPVPTGVLTDFDNCTLINCAFDKELIGDVEGTNPLSFEEARVAVSKLKPSPKDMENFRDNDYPFEEVLVGVRPSIFEEKAPETIPDEVQLSFPVPPEYKDTSRFYFWEDDYEIIPVKITFKGPLKALILRTQDDRIMRIYSFQNSSPLASLGVAFPGDWLTCEHGVPVSYDEFIAKLNSPHRPWILHVARRKQVPRSTIPYFTAEEISAYVTPPNCVDRTTFKFRKDNYDIIVHHEHSTKIFVELVYPKTDRRFVRVSRYLKDAKCNTFFLKPGDWLCEDTNGTPLSFDKVRPPPCKLIVARERKTTSKSSVSSPEKAKSAPVESKTRTNLSSNKKAKTTLKVQTINEDDDDDDCTTEKSPPPTPTIFDIGMKFSKEFDGEYFQGEIISYNKEHKLYHVVYEDGDEEELEHDELAELTGAAKPARSSHDDTNTKRKTTSKSSVSSPKKAKSAPVESKNESAKHASTRTNLSSNKKAKTTVKFQTINEDDDDDDYTTESSTESTRSSHDDTNTKRKTTSKSSVSSHKKTKSAPVEATSDNKATNGAQVGTASKSDGSGRDNVDSGDVDSGTVESTQHAQRDDFLEGIPNIRVHNYSDGRKGQLITKAPSKDESAKRDSKDKSLPPKDNEPTNIKLNEKKDDDDDTNHPSASSSVPTTVHGAQGKPSGSNDNSTKTGSDTKTSGSENKSSTNKRPMFPVGTELLKHYEKYHPECKRHTKKTVYGVVVWANHVPTTENPNLCEYKVKWDSSDAEEESIESFSEEDDYSEENSDEDGEEKLSKQPTKKAKEAIMEEANVAFDEVLDEKTVAKYEQALDVYINYHDNLLQKLANDMGGCTFEQVEYRDNKAGDPTDEEIAEVQGDGDEWTEFDQQEFDKELERIKNLPKEDQYWLDSDSDLSTEAQEISAKEIKELESGASSESIQIMMKVLGRHTISLNLLKSKLSQKTISDLRVLVCEQLKIPMENAKKLQVKIGGKICDPTAHLFQCEITKATNLYYGEMYVQGKGGARYKRPRGDSTKPKVHKKRKYPTKHQRKNRFIKELREFNNGKRGKPFIPKKAFKRLVRSIADAITLEMGYNNLSHFKFRKDAYEALQECGEQYLAHLFHHADLVTRASKRITLLRRDLACAMMIRGERNSWKVWTEPKTQYQKDLPQYKD